MHVRQIPRHTRWPSGDSLPLAVLVREPSELAAHYELTFEWETDDLDELQLAAIALNDGSQAWLYKHRSDPNPGTVVRIDADANLAHAKVLLKQALGLTDSDFLWVTPAAETSAASA